MLNFVALTQPYDAPSSVMLGPPFEGHLELTIDVDGESRHVQVSDSKSGFAPAKWNTYDAPRLYE